MLAVAGCGGTSPVATVTNEATVTVTAPSPSGTTTSASTSATPPLPFDAVPTIYEQALEAVSAGTPVTMRRFVSPSGNFFCDLQVVEGVAGCELTRTTLAPNADVTCDPTVNARVGRLMIEDGVVQRTVQHRHHPHGYDSAGAALRAHRRDRSRCKLEVSESTDRHHVHRHRQ